MATIIDFVQEYIFVYLWLILTTFINMVAPTPGSTVVNPVTAFFTDPWRAIGIAGFTFFLTGIHRVYLFRKEILSNKKNLNMVGALLPYSIVGAVLGGTLISYLNIKILVLIIISVSLYFIWKTILNLVDNEQEHSEPTSLSSAFVGVLSGFLQGSGMPGSDIRNNYMRMTLPEISVRATGSLLGLFNFFIAGSIIFFHNKLERGDFYFILCVVPLLLVAQVYGKKLLTKIPDKKAKILAVSLSLLGTVLLVYKYLL